MSLLTSLMQAGSQLQQSIGQKARAPADESAAAAARAPEAVSGKDDQYIPSGGKGRGKSSQLSVTDYKEQVGKDTAFVRETLRHKLAEYSLNPATRLGVSRAEDGSLGLEGRMPEKNRQQIETDLNNSSDFRAAFNRLSVNEPTLAFVDTALKLNQAYGVDNSLLNTLVSENRQFNGLQDLVHRYDNLRQNARSEQLEAAGQESRYAFSLNTSA